MYVFFQLIILRPHPHFTRHDRKKSAKPSAFYTFENPIVRRSAFYRRPTVYHQMVGFSRISRVRVTIRINVTIRVGLSFSGAKVQKTQINCHNQWYEVRTWDICGRRQKSLGSTAPGCRRLARWHSITPSRSSWAKSNTSALSLATGCSAGKTWHLINHSAHNFQSTFAILLVYILVAKGRADQHAKNCAIHWRPAGDWQVPFAGAPISKLSSSGDGRPWPQ